MILNESLRFADVDPTVKRAFQRAPDKMLIAPRVRLYKWTSRPLTDGSRITPGGRLSNRLGFRAA
jgi:hypothetical protein